MSETEPWSYHVDGSPVYSLADIIRKRSAITPGLIAFTEAGRLTSFAELDQRSSQVARALQRKDVCPGDRVAFIGASGPEFAEVMYGAAKCRAIFTAVNNRLSAVPFFHVAGLGMLLAANVNGGNLLLEQQADIAGVLRLLVDRQVTHAVLWKA